MFVMLWDIHAFNYMIHLLIMLCCKLEIWSCVVYVGLKFYVRPPIIFMIILITCVFNTGIVCCDVSMITTPLCNTALSAYSCLCHRMTLLINDSNVIQIIRLYVLFLLAQRNLSFWDVTYWHKFGVSGAVVLHVFIRNVISSLNVCFNIVMGLWASNRQSDSLLCVSGCRCYGYYTGITMHAL